VLRADASTDFGSAVPLFNNSRVRCRRAIFCLRSRWNLDLSPLRPDILNSCKLGLVVNQRVITTFLMCLKQPCRWQSERYQRRREKRSKLCGPPSDTRRIGDAIEAPPGLSIAKAQKCSDDVSSRLRYFQYTRFVLIVSKPSTPRAGGQAFGVSTARVPNCECPVLRNVREGLPLSAVKGMGTHTSSDFSSSKAGPPAQNCRKFWSLRFPSTN